MVIFIFLIGVILGSFLNVCIYRIPKKESISYPSSYCTSCSSPLKWFHLIPILSYMIQRGKCGYCRESISLQYPIIELLNGLIAMIIYIRFGWGMDFVFYLLISSILIVISFIDLNHGIIPNFLNIIILILGIIYRFINFILYDIPLDLIDGILGFSISSFAFIVIIIVSKGGMGFGDFKLIGVLGFLLGIKKILLNIFLAFLVGSIVSIFLLVFKIKKRTDSIPFGPFICIAFMITIFWGIDILKNFNYI